MRDTGGGSLREAVTPNERMKMDTDALKAKQSELLSALDGYIHNKVVLDARYDKTNYNELRTEYTEALKSMFNERN